MSAISGTTDRAARGVPVPGAQRAQPAWTGTLARALTGLALLGALVVAVAALVLALNWRSQPFIGALLTRTLIVDGSRSAAQQPWPALAAGLQRGDQIIALNEQGLGLPNDFDTLLRGFGIIRQTLREGDLLQVGFLRNSDLARAAPELCAPVVSSPDRCNVRFRIGAFPSEDFIAFFVVPWLTGAIVLAVAAAVFALRSGQPAARTVVVALAALSVFLTGLFDLYSTYTLAPLWIVSAVVLGGLLLSLAFVFPTRSSLAYRQPLLVVLPLLLAFIVGGALASLYLDPPAPDSASALTLSAGGLALAGLAGLMLALRARRRGATSALARDQINAVFIGVALALSIGLVWVLNVVARALTGAELVPLNLSAAAPFFAIPALSLGYAVLQYRAFNTERVISQGLTYTLMLAALVAGYFLLVLGASWLTRSAIGADNPVLIAVVIFLMALLFVPVRTRIEAQVERVFFRRRADHQQRIEAFARELVNISGPRALVQAYEHALADVLSPEQVLVFLQDVQTGEYRSAGSVQTDVRFGADSALIASLQTAEAPLRYLEPGQPWEAALLAERARLRILRALAIAPFRGSERLNGFAVIGPPQSGAGRYSYDELRFIENLNAQMNIAVERAQVVETLQRRVRELNVIGQVSQAVNFTLRYDELLELISTQALRLVEATHFYVVLRDGDELTYAFYEEDAERSAEREGLRWAFGGDVYSDILRTGQPLRTPSLERFAAERGLEVPPHDPAVQAWMAAPLVSGSTELGAIAAASTQVGRQFSDEQFKVFADVAALAAGALAKTRLLDETVTRARQLSVLNDISRRLVASELNLEALLSLITGSASEILDTEAGSLLLTAEDGSGELVFRVVVGGSGGDLVGMRLPARKGLVGEVASTARPVIVQDVASDPRWAGELGGGPFVTRSVIAVPLISQNTVIGVLELLNKREGSFTRDDADLLTTFAGQAAVAIENARLFQLTDQQLSMRVSELETLERIDVELNRSLDLEKVARITTEWALENSSATAAMLGLVRGEPPMLEVVYAQGYDADDLPEGADGRRLPLDRGIVSRVLRTRQAEVVPDVRIDRDYVPSLRSALSQITIPVISGGQVNGMLILETDREPRLRLADMPFLQRLMEHASIAITNAQLYEELARANSSKSEFVSFVAHELKNPLTSIRGYAEFLLGAQTGSLSDMQRNFVSTIRSNADRMNTLVSDLNDVTKLQTNNLRIDRRPIDFRRVVDESLRPLQKQFEDRRQQVVLDLPAALPAVLADEGRMVQVMTNLLSNATKYTPEGGTIRVQAHVDDRLRDENGRPLPPQMVASVSDTGIGMSEEDLSRLFTPYFRSENPMAQAQPGTGLGMTITRGIVEQHGGSVMVESRLGEGSTFRFSLPLAAEAAGA